MTENFKFAATLAILSLGIAFSVHQCVKGDNLKPLDEEQAAKGCLRVVSNAAMAMANVQGMALTRNKDGCLYGYAKKTAPEPVK